MPLVDVFIFVIKLFWIFFLMVRKDFCSSKYSILLLKNCGYTVEISFSGYTVIVDKTQIKFVR